MSSSRLTGLVAVAVKWEKLPDLGTKMLQSLLGPISETAFRMGGSMGIYPGPCLEILYLGGVELEDVREDDGRSLLLLMVETRGTGAGGTW